MASSYSIGLDDLKSRLGEKRLIELTDDAGTEAIDSARVDDAIATAEAEFHLYAGVYYQIPLRTSAATVPQGVREKLIEAAAWRLMQRRSEFLQGAQDEGKQWADRRDETLAWYGAVASTDLKKRLPIPDAVEKTNDEVLDNFGSPRVLSDDSLFSRCSLRRF